MRVIVITTPMIISIYKLTKQMPERNVFWFLKPFLNQLLDDITINVCRLRDVDEIYKLAVVKILI